MLDELALDLPEVISSSVLSPVSPDHHPGQKQPIVFLLK